MGIFLNGAYSKKKSKKVYFCNKGGFIKDELFRGLTF